MAQPQIDFSQLPDKLDFSGLPDKPEATDTPSLPTQEITPEEEPSSLDRILAAAKAPSPAWIQPFEHAVTNPLVSAETVGTGLKAIGDIGATSQEDLQESGPEKAAREREAQLISGLSSPASAALIAGVATGVAAPAAPLIEGTFAAQGTGGAIQAVYDYRNAETPEERAKAIVDFAGNAGMALPIAAKTLADAAMRTPVETPAGSTETAPAQPATAPEAPAGVTTPEVAQNATAGRVEPITARVQPATEVAPEERESLNAQLEPEKGAPAPVTATATAEAPQVREALNLDEIRLLRERSELQFEKDLQSRAGNPNPPALDERISEINDQLDDLANREMAPNQAEVPEGTFDAQRGIEQDQLARAEEDANVQDAFRPQDEPRPSDSSSEDVAQPTGQRSAAPEQPSGVANRASSPTSAEAGSAVNEPIGVAERYAREELGDDAVIPGTGQSWQASRDFGHKYIADGGDPELPIRRASRNTGSDVGIVAAKYEDLAAARRQALDNLAKDPNNPARVDAYNAAEKAQAEWRQKMQPVLTRASRELTAAQGDRVYNPGNLNDLIDKSIDANKKAPSVQETAALKGAVDKYRAADKDVVNAAEKVRAAARKRSAGQTMSIDELRAKAEEFVKSKLADCVT